MLGASLRASLALLDRRAATMRTLVVVASLVHSGCASVPLAPTSVDLAAKEFRPASGRASLYVFRPDTFKLSAITVGVTIDGYSFGVNKAGTFLHAELPPGRYVLLSQSEQEMPVAVQLDADQCYFFQQDVSFGSRDARSSLLRVDEAAGREAVRKSRLAASQVPAR